MSKQKANWLDPNTTAENEVLPRYFKWAWTSRGLSLALNVILIMQLTYYCTDLVGMSATLVGTLLLASKVFDGVTDLFVGFIIDKTNTKLGKARPYEIFIVFIWILTVFLFSMPNLSDVGKSVFVFVLYSLINSVCSTFLNGGDAVYLARAVRSEKNRVSVMSFNGAVIMLVSIAINIFIPQLIAGVGATKAGWTIIALIFAVPCGMLGLGRFFFVKEVAAEGASGEDGKADRQNKMSIGESLKALAKNKYIFMLAGMTFIVQLISNLTAATNYYFKYVFGDIGAASFVSLASIVTPLILAFFPVLTRKFGTVKILRMGAGIGVAGYILRMIGGTNMITLIAGSLLSGIGIIPVTMMISIYLIDCMDYGEWKTGVRVEGVMTSVNSFTSKLGSGIASALVGLIMGMAGYDGALEVQPDAAIGAIKFLFNGLPLVGMVLLLVIAIAYKLDAILPQIKADLKKKRAAQ